MRKKYIVRCIVLLGIIFLLTGQHIGGVFSIKEESKSLNASCPVKSSLIYAANNNNNNNNNNPDLRNGGPSYHATPWQSFTVDDRFGVGTYTSLAADDEGALHISYYDSFSGSLKYAYRHYGDWELSTIKSDEDLGQYTSITIDNSRHPHISYYDSAHGDLRYIHWDGNNWHDHLLDSQGDVGMYSSIDIDRNGFPHLSYYDSTNGDLKYYILGNQWYYYTLKSIGNVGRYSQIEIDSSGRPHIVYLNVDTGELHYTWWSGEIWVNDTITSQVGGHVSFVLDGNDMPHISHYDMVDHCLVYSHHNGNGWISTIIDQQGFTGTYTSITIDRFNRPLISYYDQTSKILKFAYDEGHGWNTTSADDQPQVGTFTSIDVAGDDSIFISYYDETRSSLKCAVLDMADPAFISNYVTQPTTGDECQFTVNARDNIEVVLVRVNYTYDEVHYHAQNLLYQGNEVWEGSILISNYSSTIIFSFLLMDLANNYHLTDTHLRTVQDNDPPVYHGSYSNDTPATGDPFQLMINSSDNIGISSVNVIFDFDHGNILNVSMTETEKDIWVRRIDIPKNARRLFYSFLVRDQNSNNLQVRDDEDNGFVLNITDDISPDAGNYEDIYVDQDEEVIFNADSSHDNRGISDYIWSIELVSETHVVHGQYVAYTFGDPGCYSVTLTVRDETGNSDNATFQVYVKDTVTPLIKLGDDRTIFQNDTITLNPSRTWDNVGIKDYEWTFTYGGSERIFRERTLVFRFEIPGLFNISCRVNDNASNFDVDYILIKVLDTAPPLAFIYADTSQDVISPGAVIKLFGDGSIDNVGIVNYTWIYEGGGTSGKEFGDIITLKFINTGIYNITLTVRDLEGNLDTDNHIIRVMDNVPPVIIIRMGDAKISNGGFYNIEKDTFPVLDASRSHDEGGIHNYSWLLEHQSGDELLYGPMIQPSLQEPGIYIVTLTVEDVSGNKEKWEFFLETGGISGISDKGLELPLPYWIVVTLLSFLFVLLVVFIIIVLLRRSMKNIKEGSRRKTIRKSLKCNLCSEFIEYSFFAYKCSCGLVYHMNCIRSRGECTGCGMDLELDMDYSMDDTSLADTSSSVYAASASVHASHGRRESSGNGITGQEQRGDYSNNYGNNVDYDAKKPRRNIYFRRAPFSFEHMVMEACDFYNLLLDKSNSDLRLDYSANPTELKKARRIIIKYYHPDISKKNKESATRIMQQANAAWEILKNVK